MLFTKQGILSFNFIDLNYSRDKFRAIFAQDDRPILHFNANMRKHDDELWNGQGEMKHVARIPLWKWLEWERLGITADDKALTKAIEQHSEYKTTRRRI